MVRTSHTLALFSESRVQIHTIPLLVFLITTIVGILYTKKKYGDRHQKWSELKSDSKIEFARKFWPRVM